MQVEITHDDEIIGLATIQPSPVPGARPSAHHTTLELDSFEECPLSRSAVILSALNG